MMKYTIDEKEFDKVVKYITDLENKIKKLNELNNNFDEYNRQLIQERKNYKKNMDNMESQIYDLRKSISILKNNESLYVRKIQELKCKLESKPNHYSTNIFINEENDQKDNKSLKSKIKNILYKDFEKYV